MTRANFAIIHPLRYSLKNWRALRSRISELSNGEASLSAPWQRLVPNTDAEFLFSQRLEPAQTLLQAFHLLAQESEIIGGYVLRLEVLEEQLRAVAAAGLNVTEVGAYLIIRNTGDCLLVTLIAATLSQESQTYDSDPDLTVQRRIRALYSDIRNGPLGNEVDRCVTGALESFGLGLKSKELLKLGLLQHDNAHILTLVETTDSELTASLARVHIIEEGNSEDQCEQFGLTNTEGYFVHFGWSYSTIAGIDSGISYRVLMPLVAIQGSWYRYKQIRNELIASSRTIDDLKSDREIIDQSEFYSDIAFETRVWNAENESFERALKPTFAMIYKWIWAYWDIDKSRSVVMESAGYLRDMLDRRHERAVSARSRTQSKILFVIAIMQLGSIYGIIQGYLGFVDRSLVDERTIYGSYAFYGFTLISPLILLLTIVAIVIYFYRRLN